jgi:hypothetical protein
MVATAPVVETPLNEQNVPGSLNYFQTLSPIRRKNLVLGNKVQFVDHLGSIVTSGKHTVEMSIALFKAVSEKHNLIVDGKVVVPDGINVDAVKHLVALVLALPTAKRVYQFQKYAVKDVLGRPIKDAEDTFKDLHLCCAADALGMGSFTQGLFNRFFSRMNTAVPHKDIIEMITSARNPTADKLFKQMSYTIAMKLYEKTFTTGDMFRQYYLPTNPRLSKAIYGFLTKFQESAGRDAAFQERQAKRERLAREEADNQRRFNERVAAKAAKEQLAAEEAAQWKAAGESYRQKVRNGKKNFTAIEVSYAWKVVGKRVAAAAGN